MATVKLHLKKQFNKDNSMTPNKMHVGYRERGVSARGPLFFFDEPTEVDKEIAEKILAQAPNVIEVWDEKKMKEELKEEQKKQFEKRIEDLKKLLEDSGQVLIQIEEQLKEAKKGNQTLAVEQCQAKMKATKDTIQILEDKIKDTEIKLKDLEKKPDPKTAKTKKTGTKKKSDSKK
jgi:septal ring factor EnvC (AmiA/AmiB activator)